MNIAGIRFRLIRGSIMYNCAGVLVYKHKDSNKCFVRAMRNCRMQRSKNNYPTQLKRLLKDQPSEVVIYLGELPKSTTDALFLSSRSVCADLSERGLLWKEDSIKARGIYRPLNGEEDLKHKVVLITHKDTGAVFYAHEQASRCSASGMAQRLTTFNNYVRKDIVNPNRVMHAFTRRHGQLGMEHFVLRDVAASFTSEKDAKTFINKKCFAHLQNNEIVLNRIADMDALYYRNSILKLDHASMDQYLKLH